MSSSPKRLKIAVVGCGEVAQIMHIPYLIELDSHFDLAAVTDISPSVARRVAERYRIPAWYSDYEKMLEQERPDAVVILTSNEYHAPFAVQAMEHGAHVLVEKPMCISLEEAEEMVSKAEALNKVLMVAYMKRYDPNYRLGVQMYSQHVDNFGPPQFVRVHDFCHDNRTVINDVYDIIRPEGDIPEEANKERLALLDRRLKEALGDASQIQKNAYLLLLGLASHDMTVLRGMMGDPSRVEHTQIYGDGRTIFSLLDYDGVPCTFEIGGSQRLWMDESVTAYFPTVTIGIEFPSPYMKNAETKVIQRETDENLQTIYSERIASRDEAFRRELLEFHEAIVEGRPALTNGREGLRDIEWLREIALKAKV